MPWHEKMCFTACTLPLDEAAASNRRTRDSIFLREALLHRFFVQQLVQMAAKCFRAFRTLWHCCTLQKGQIVVKV